MGVCVEQVFDVFDVETQRRDIVNDRLLAAGETAVDQCVTVRARDQINSDTFSADIIKIADNVERIDRRGPVGLLFRPVNTPRRILRV